MCNSVARTSLEVVTSFTDAPTNILAFIIFLIKCFASFSFKVGFEILFNAKKNFVVNTYYVICDTLVQQLNIRNKAYSSVHKIFEVLFEDVKFDNMKQLTEKLFDFIYSTINHYYIKIYLRDLNGIIYYLKHNLISVKQR